MTHAHTDTEKDNTRRALLKAARDLFLKNTYANISIRKIADKAKVNSAMIAYYFGSKSGLFREMIKSYIEGSINTALHSVERVDRLHLREFMANFYRSVPAELTHLIARTMLFERNETREWLLENLMQPAFAAAMKISKAVIDESGKEIDPLVLRTSLQAMLVFPKYLQPLLQEMHPNDINEDFYARLATFQAELVAHYFELEKN